MHFEVMLYLKDVIFLGAFLWPVTMTEMVTVVLESGQHDNDDAALFPDHLPEIGNCLAQWTLCYDVRGVPGIVISLKHNSLISLTIF